MNFSEPKRLFSFTIYLIVFFFVFSCLFSSPAQAADVQAELDSHDGSSGFTIENSLGAGIDRIDSNGNLGVGTTSVQTLLYVSPQGLTPTYAGPADAYIQNNLEVDGTAYLNDVFINGLEVNGLTFQGGSSLNVLTVAGPSYLAISSGNVGIGTSTPGSKFTVNGGAAIGNGYRSLLAPTNGLLVQGNVGIGSTTPGNNLDVNGGIRTTNFAMSGQAPVSGYVLTASDSAGDATWTAAGTVAGWTTVGNDVYETLRGNVGIGTSTTAQGALVVTNGNVGIGTWAPTSLFQINQPTGTPFVVNGTGNVGVGTTTTNNRLSVLGGAAFGSYATTAAPAGGAIFSGNVGMGLTVPGQALDVNGTVRALGFTMGTNAPVSGYVLTASDSAGDATWTAAGTVAGWTTVGNDVYETLRGNVGIGTSTTTQGALVVTNGNVGVGTWAPTSLFQINQPTGTPFVVNGTGNVGVGTTTTNNLLSVLGGAAFGSYATTAAPVGGAIFSGNIGVGLTAPGQALDVSGTVRALGFTMGTNAPVSGYVLTASDSAGDATWTAAGTVAGWTTVGNDVYETLRGNVGIGTSTTTQGALIVTNGNVGVGTWAPVSLFQVNQPTGAPFVINGTGNVGVGTTTPQGGFVVTNGNVGVGTWAPPAPFYVSSGGNGAAAIGLDNNTYIQQKGAGGVLNNILGLDSASVLHLSNKTGAGYISFETGSLGVSRVAVDVTGNMGIGTILPVEKLTVNGGVGIGTTFSSFVTTSAPSGGLIVQNNVGIGSLAPGQILDVQGTVRALGFTMGTNAPVSGYVLTASDSAGDATWTAAGTVAGWTTVGNDVYETLRGNVGIGTSTTTQGALVVTNGNVGVGTWAPVSLFQVNQPSNSPFVINGTGNVGIGTTTPQGAFTVTNGNVGIGTWAPTMPLVVNGNVGIGTNLVSANQLAVYSTTAATNELIKSTSAGAFLNIDRAATSNAATVTYASAGSNKWSEGLNLNATNDFSISNLSRPDFVLNAGATFDNVGIGTYVAGSRLSIAGGVGIGTGLNSSYVSTAAPSGGMIVQGNVGIGSLAPGQVLDVQGTVRALGFTMGTNAPVSGYVLTASDSAGDATWTAAGTVAGWTTVGNDVYETLRGNVGIGTSTTTQGALVVTNGNVGIGTWTTSKNLFNVSGSVGIGTWNALYSAPSNGLIVQGNMGVGTYLPPVEFAVGAGVPTQATAVDDAYFSHDVEIRGNLYATTVIGGQIMQGDLDLGGFFIKATTGIANGSILIHGGLGPDTPDLVVAANSFVGIGTTSPASRLTIAGNLGIGTTGSAYVTTPAPINGMMVQGNVGIGSTAPGKSLDVQGTVRALGFTMGTNAPVSGYVLTASDSAGDATWTAAGTVAGWTTVGNDVYETLSGNVGIGTSTTTQGALVVTNGNVGIGTWAPVSLFQVNQPAGAPFVISGTGNVGVGTTTPQSGFAVTNGNVGIGTWTAAGGNLIIKGGGNVGIGSTWPGQVLDVQGTVRALGFTMGTNAPVSGYVLTASDSAGDATWTAAGTVAGWTTVGNDVYETLRGNVGIGTTTTTQGALVVTNGNVGVGTWAPVSLFQVNQPTGAPFAINGTGNVGVGTTTPQGGFVVTNGNVGIGTWAPRGLLEATSSLSGTPFILDTNGNVGIGTTITSNAALSVMNGNVGMGTWKPVFLLDVESNANVTLAGFQTALTSSLIRFKAGNGSIKYIGSDSNGRFNIFANNAATNLFTVTEPGNVGIGSVAPAGSLDVEGTYPTVFSAASANSAVNVGIGSYAPGQRLDVQGTVRALGFTMGTNAPVSGYVLTASDSAGDATWTAAGTVAGWTTVGNDVYETLRGNVGIGTTTTTQGALVVTNGNVGVGTWAPVSLFQVNEPSGSPFVINGTGNVGVGTTTPQGALVVTNGNVGIGTWAPRGLFDVEGTVAGSLLTVSANGNVGIGTWVPSAPLNVTGSVFNTISAVGGFYSTGTVRGFYTTSGGALTWDNSLTKIMGDGVNGGVSNYISFLTNNAERARFDNNGNLGVGSTGPTGKLDVEGTYPAVFYATASSNVTNVGIGSYAPGQKLDVQGTVRALGFNMGTNSPASGYVLTASDSAGDATWTPAGSVGPWTQIGTNVYTTGNNVGVGTTTPQGGFVVSSGNVGIGTWSPASLFQVNQPSGSPFAINGTGNVGIGTITPQGAFTVTNGNVGVGTWAPATLFDVQGTFQHFYVNSFGNVGIGTANPGVALDVGSAGNGRIRAGTIDIYATAPKTYEWNYFSTAPAGLNLAEVGAGNQRIYFRDGGNVGIGTNVTLNKLAVAGTMGIGADYASVAAPTNGLIVQGNVGLGSLAPGQALDVQGTVRALGFTMGTNAPVSGYVLTASDSAGDATWTAAGTVAGWTTVGNDVYETLRGNVGIGTTTTTQGALVVTNGNVGVGTWAPVSLFQVNQPSGSPFVINGTGNVGIGTTTPQGGFVVTNGNVGIGTWAPAGLLDAQGTLTHFYTTTSGNVGIGSIAPTSLLDVAAVAGGVSAVFGTGSTGISLKYGWPGIGFNEFGNGTVLTMATGYTGVINFDPSSGRMIFSTASSSTNAGTAAGPIDRLTITNSGNIGIGTYVPSSKLGIIGNIGIGTGQSSSYIYTSPPNGGMLVENNVGIGTLAPGQKLDVQGTVRALGFNMGTNSPASGYVLTASDSAGDATWTPAGSVGPWTQIGTNVYTTGNNVGVGTTTPQGAFVVTSGNVGIGTWTTDGGNLIIRGTGNVGIGSAWPGQMVDVQGTVRAIAFVGNGAGLTSVVATPAGGANAVQYSNGTNTVGLETGFSFNGTNVGIGTTNGTSLLDVRGQGYFSSNVGIGSVAPNGRLDVEGTFPVIFNALNGSTGNVGIGSFTPGQRLDVQGTVRALGFNMGTNSPASGYVLTASDSAGDATWTPAGSVGPWTQVGTNVYTTGNNVGIGTTTPQGAFVVTNGNIGIGTWAPAYALDVNGTINTTSYLLVKGAQVAQAGTAVTLSQEASYGNLQSWNSQPMYINPLGNNIVLDNGTGNVGVGTANPQNKFSVGGNAAIGAAYSTVNAPSNGLIVQSNVGVGSTVPNGKLDVEGTFPVIFNAVAGSTGNVGIGSFAPGQRFDVQGTVRALGFVMGTNGPASGYVLTASDSAGDATWTAAGSVGPWTQVGTFIYETGNNIGVGSAAPGAQLDVNGTARVTGFTLLGQGAAGGNVLVSDTVGVGTWMSGSTLAGSINGLTSNFVPKAGSATSLTNSLIFDNGTNVGIGSTGPGGRLDVEGTFPVVFNAVSTGNVGIGSFTPGQRFDVQGTVRALGFIMGTNGPASGYVLTASDSAGDATWTAAGSVGPWTQVGTNIYETGSNVGVGTVAPGTALDVNGTLRITGIGQLIMPNGNVGIGTTTPQGAFVVTNGNVGVGTWAPRGLLDVEGTVGASYFIVNGGNVGVGTWAPQNVMQVSGGTNPVLQIQNSSSLVNETSGIEFSNGTSSTHSAGIQSIRTNAPASGDSVLTFSVRGNSNYMEAARFDTIGNLGIGSVAPSGLLDVEGTSAPIIFNAASNTSAYNVGIGSYVPGQKLDVQGTVRALGFNMRTNGPASGYVLTASDSAGDATWTAAGSVGPWTQTGTFIYETGNNIGVGSTAPGVALDVNGTVRANTFIGNGSGITGVTAVPAGGLNAVQYTNGVTTLGNESLFSFNGSNVGIGTTNGAGKLDVRGTLTVSAFEVSTEGNVGIGTSTPQGGLVVTNGNVGIGTWAPNQSLTVTGGLQANTYYMPTSAAVISSQSTTLNFGASATWTNTALYSNGSEVMRLTGGNVGIGSTVPNAKLDVEGTFPVIFNAISSSTGNVGIGSFTPGQRLDVQGTVRALGFNMGTNGPASGYVLTASDSAGDATWTAAGSVGPWTQTGTLIYETGNNVGIGSAAPGTALDINGTLRITGTGQLIMPNGNVGIGTTTPQGAFVVTNGNVGLGTWAPSSNLTLFGSMAVTVVSKSANYAATANDNVILVSASGGAVAITLPSAATVPGREYVVKKTDATANAVTISDAGAATIDGQASVATSVQYQSYVLVSDGTNWNII
jgi:hypothetical protein